MLGVGVQAGVCRVETVDVGEQDQLVGGHEHGDLGGEEVVVAEGDLVGRRRVVLVDDGQDTPVQQGREGLAGVQVVGAGAHVEEGEQHLGRGDVPVAQQFVVDPVQLALSDRAGRLQCSPWR